MVNDDVTQVPIPQHYTRAGMRDETRTQATLSSSRTDPNLYIDLILANSWLVAGIAAIVIAAGLAYAFLSIPIYKATVLFQVEDIGALPRAVSPTDSLKSFDIKTAGAPELEVLKSRMVLSAAVDKAHLYIDVKPHYFPVLGSLAARHNLGNILPPWLLTSGHVWSNARVDVTRFDVPAAYERAGFLLTILPGQRFSVTLEDAGVAFTGYAGQPLRANTPMGPLDIQVDRMAGRPGEQFTLIRNPRLAAIEKLQRDIEVSEKGRQSGVIAVALEDDDARRAALVLNEVAHQYLMQNEHRISEGAEKQLAFLERQLPELKKTLEESEFKYNEARNRWGLVDLGEEAKGLLQVSVLGQTKLLELNQKKAELMARFEAGHPAVQAITNQIAALNREADHVNGKIKRLPQIEQEILQLRRDVSVNTDVYTNVMNAAQQLRLASASKVGNVRLLDLPETPVTPVKPKRALAVLSSAVLGLLLGLLAVLAKKMLGGRVYNPMEIERSLQVPVAGIVLHSNSPRNSAKDKRKPWLSWMQKGDSAAVLPREMPEDAAVEGLRRLQCLLHESRGRDGQRMMRLTYAPGAGKRHGSTRVVVIVGPTPGVGKSFISSNFAAVLASSRRRVLLIDADLRTGALHRRFGLERGVGLCEAVGNQVKLEQAVHREVMPFLDFLSTGGLPRRPVDVLSDSQFGDMLQHAAGTYDVVVIDTAPLLTVADTLMIVPHADLILNIVRAGKTSLGEIEEVEKQLERMGAGRSEVVYNDMRSRQTRYGYSAAYV